MPQPLDLTDALQELHDLEQCLGPRWTEHQDPEGRRVRSLSRPLSFRERELLDMVIGALISRRDLTPQEHAYALTLEAPLPETGDTHD